jgi:hypothetical protein
VQLIFFEETETCVCILGREATYLHDMLILDSKFVKTSRVKLHTLNVIDWDVN